MTLYGADKEGALHPILLRRYNQIGFGGVAGVVSEAVLSHKTATTAGADDTDSAVRLLG